MSHSLKAMLRLGAIVTAIVMVASPYAQIGTLAPQTASAATPEANTFITGRITKPDGSVFSFPCMGQPGQPPPQGSCGPGIGAFAGPGNEFFGGAGSDGTFSINVAAGKYKFQVSLPPEQLGAFSFSEQFVEVTSGATVNLGTIVPKEKLGRINGFVYQNGTTTGLPGVQLSAFPIGGQGGQEGGSGPGGMMPSSATTDASGAFSIAVNAGHYGINLENRPDSQYVRADTGPLDVDIATDSSVVSGIIINAIKADATITGRILDQAGAQVQLPGGVGARPVGATDFFDFNGPIQPPGNYTVKVPSATATQYTLSIHMPPGSDYSVSGTVTVTVVPNGTVSQDITVAKNTSSIFGKVISESGFALNSCKSTDTAKFGGQGFGEVFANNPQNGVFANGIIKEDCTYILSIGAGEYFFGYHLNPQAGFVNRPAPPDPIVVAANQNVEKNIKVVAGDARITGQVLKADGTPFANVFVDVGNEREIEQTVNSGGQKGPGPSSEGEFRGPGDTKSPEDMMKFCSNKANAAECKNFKLPPGSTGPGGCTDMLACSQYCQKNQKVCQEFDKGGHDNPNGATGQKVLGQGAKRVTAAGKSFALAENVTKEGNGGPDYYRENIIHAGSPTDASGKFEILVPSGHTYELRTNVPPDKDTGSLVPPKSVQVDMKTVKSVSVVLQFRTAFGTMSGKVSLPNGTGASRCFIGYWSEDGSNGGTNCKSDGTFSLGYEKGKLHLRADSFDGTTGYRSDEEVVVITTEKTLTKNITLKQGKFEVFQPTTKTCDATASCTMTLDNGAIITAPANSLASSGNVTISAQPTLDIKGTENDSLADVGYSLTATDASGNAITNFDSSVTMELPYNEDAVEDSGLDESFLKSKYVDDTTGSFQDLSNCTQDEANNKFTCLTDHFTDFAVVGAAIGGKTDKVTVTESKGKVTVSIAGVTRKITLATKGGKKADWNVGTGNFGEKAGGQLIMISNIKSGNTISVYGKDAKLKKKITVGPGIKGVDQEVEDFNLDGKPDVTVAPTSGPAKAYMYDFAKGLKSITKTTLETGKAGKTGKTTLSAVILTSGSATLASYFDTDKETRAFKTQKKGKTTLLVRDTKVSTLSRLKVTAGSVEKKTETPKVKKATSCSKSGTSKMTFTGSGFGSESPIALWNGATALAAKVSGNGTKLSLTLNSSVITILGTNTLTIVNSDGQAGVKVVSCK